MKDDEPIGSNPVEEQAFRVAYLVAGFIRHTLTDAENIELDDWVTASMDNQRLFEKLTDEKNLDDWKKYKDGIDTAGALERIKSKIAFTPAKRKSVVRSSWTYLAAASVLVALMIGYFYFSKPKQIKPGDMVEAKPADIAPGANKAILTLANGKIIDVDSIRTGELAFQGNSHINKLDSGQLAYQAVPHTTLPQVDLFNTLTVPAGGQFTIVLPDGTKVWLNASSSLKYPTVFAGPKRIVELTGEGYFEVFKDPMFPFEVSVNGSVVQVLGTHFNINAYNDEPVLKVTLAEGSVKLNNAMLLKPGEEAAVSKNGNMLKSKADMESALSWKNNQFVFKESTIETVMRQVARWYNASIVYDSSIKDHFNAAIPRSVPVSKLLHLLEGTGEVHFKIDNNKITVMK